MVRIEHYQKTLFMFVRRAAFSSIFIIFISIPVYILYYTDTMYTYISTNVCVIILTRNAFMKYFSSNYDMLYIPLYIWDPVSLSCMELEYSVNM